MRLLQSVRTNGFSQSELKDAYQKYSVRQIGDLSFKENFELASLFTQETAN